jgi:hypothetical protein
VNDVRGGKPILVTFCPLTGSGIVYDPELDGRVLNFGVSGLLFDNNLLMFDRATDSLWSQMRVQSICGSFRETRPRLLPVVQSTWAGWKLLHLGILHDGLARAYSKSRMAEAAPRLAVNDVVNGLPVLIAFDAGFSLAIPFGRRLLSADGTEVRETLELDVVEDGAPLFRLKDRQTGTVWNLRGEAVEGPLLGERLRQIETYSAFWFAWAAFNRDSEIHDPAAP